MVRIMSDRSWREDRVNDNVMHYYIGDHEEENSGGEGRGSEEPHEDHESPIRGSHNATKMVAEPDYAPHRSCQAPEDQCQAPEDQLVDSAAEGSVCPNDFGVEFGLSKPDKEIRLVNASGGRIEHLGGRRIKVNAAGL